MHRQNAEGENKMTERAIFFDHIHLVSSDPHAAARWYVEKLGGSITVTVEVRGAPQVVLDFEGATLIIRGQRSGEAVLSRQGLQWGVDHFGFNVRGDLDGYCAELKRKGVVFTVEPMDFGPNLRIAFLQAPDGVIIELLRRKGSR
ncbi:MAG: VOC family protein [Desulfobacteraceae bacterium]|nr:MAG: VOC family protein [Desulfobacteraceae bacterium]